MEGEHVADGPATGNAGALEGTDELLVEGAVGPDAGLPAALVRVEDERPVAVDESVDLRVVHIIDVNEVAVYTELG